MPSVYLDGTRLALSPSQAIGKGGEADVYDIGGGKVLKLFKTAKHPDLVGFPEQQRLAEHRIAEHQQKLRQFPSGLPARVIVPEKLAFDTTNKSARVIGYVMRRVANAEMLLYRYAKDSSERKKVSGNDILAIFRDMHESVRDVHGRGVVIGDFNDLNVLVAGHEAYLIDTDSWQFGQFQSMMYTEQFVDPLICAADRSASRIVMNAPHSPNTDWYAFAVMLMRATLCVGPYGGVHQPSDPRKKIAAYERPLQHMTVFNAEVKYPKPAIPLHVLPDDLLQQFVSMFERDARGEFPRRLLENTRWTTCTACGTEHARATCPQCKQTTAAAIQSVTVVRGAVTATRIFRSDYLPQEVIPRIWLLGDRLMFESRFGEEEIGSVLGGQTKFWVGSTMGCGYYHAGTMQVFFVFDPTRKGINDGVKVAPIPGQITDTHVVFAEHQAWMFITYLFKGVMMCRALVISKGGDVLATTETRADDESVAWLHGVHGAVAVGALLFVPTDDGVVRVEREGTNVREVKKFPDTEPFVNASSRLYVGHGGIYVVDIDHQITHLKFA